MLQADALVLSDEATRVFFDRAQQRSFTPVTGKVRDDLAAAGLVEQDGSPTGAVFWYIGHLLSGTGWTITVAAPRPREFRFWITDATTIFTTANPDQEGTSLLAYCPTNDLFRILLSWVGTTPAWSMDVHLELRGQQLQDKLERDEVRFTSSGDAAEFTNQPWTLFSLTTNRKETHLNWIHTQTRGEATVWFEPSLHTDDLLTIQRPSGGVFWLPLTMIIAENSQEHT